MALVVPSTLARLDLKGLLDILIVAGITYWLLGLIHGTTAAMLLRGIAVLLLVGSFLSTVFSLSVLSWLLKNSIPAMLVSVPILFQPELRRALEQLGRAGGLLPYARAAGKGSHFIDVVARACQRLAERRWGALMVLERQTGLGEYAATGVEIDGIISVEFLLSVFYPNSPLHDGAVIIRGDRVLAAGAVLPLSENLVMTHPLGTRHRAAVGITEKTDAISVIVSEETGQISIANNGRIVRGLDEAKLRKVLEILYHPGVRDSIPGWLWGRSHPQA